MNKNLVKFDPGQLVPEKYSFIHTFVVRPIMRHHQVTFSISYGQKHLYCIVVERGNFSYNLSPNFLWLCVYVLHPPLCTLRIFHPIIQVRS